MRVWFTGGPLDGHELDVDAPPDVLFLSLRSGGEPPGVVEQAHVATYKRREEGISNFPYHVGYLEVR